MLSWGLLAVATCGAVELALRLPLARTVTGLVRHSACAGRTLRASGVSDHWKERALLLRARSVFLASVTLFVLMLAVLAPFGMLGVLTHLLDLSLAGRILTGAGAIVSLVLAFVYLALRRFAVHG